MTSPSKTNAPRSCSAAIMRVTSAVSKSSCLSGGSAALRYVMSAAIVSSSARAYVMRKRSRIERDTKSSLRAFVVAAARGEGAAAAAETGSGSGSEAKTDDGRDGGLG